jgi:hypothetical protein
VRRTVFRRECFVAKNLSLNCRSNFPSSVNQVEKLSFHWQFHRFSGLPERSGPNDQLLITARLSFDPE